MIDYKNVPGWLSVSYTYIILLLLAFVLAVSGCSGDGGSADLQDNSWRSDFAEGPDITLKWDESIDADYIQSYKIYYYTESNEPESLSESDYAVAYSLPGSIVVSIDPRTDPKAVTIDKSNTQITLHMPDNKKIYFFAITSVDMYGIESFPTPEVSCILM